MANLSRKKFGVVMAESGRLLNAHGAAVVAALALALMALNLLSVIRLKTITNDEYVHIPAGYYHLVDGTFQFNNEHPPLVKMWAALPLLLIQPDEKQPPDLRHANSSEQTWAFQSDFWTANEKRFVTIACWPRLMMLPLAALLGVLIFIYARRLFNPRAAACAVVLYSIEPTVLAHGRVVHTDIAAALAYLCFFLTLHVYHRRPTWRRAALVGASCGLALVTKFSMIILAPLLVCLVIVRVWTAQPGGEKRSSRRRVLAHGALASLIVLFIINAAYRFHSPPLEASDVRWMELKSATIFSLLLPTFNLLTHLVPTYYLFGLYNVLIHNHYGHAASLLGKHSDLGWWRYFPVAFALKTTLPFLLLSVAALLWVSWRLLFKRETIYLFLLAPLAMYTAISVTSHINIGIRHFLPAFPFLFIAGGGLLDRWLRVGGRSRLLAHGLVVVTMLWAGVEAVRAYPDYMPYMNQLAQGRPRWEYLSDSNIEWGDDVPALAAYLRARGEGRVRAALSGGWGTLRFFGVDYQDLLAAPDAKFVETRYVAIGASFLNGSTVPGGVPGREQGAARTNFFASYRNRQPEAIFGHSIYLYRVRE